MTHKTPSPACRPRALRAALGVATTLWLASAAPARAAAFEFESAPLTTPRGNLFIPCLKLALLPVANPHGIEQRLATDEVGRPVITSTNPAGARYKLVLSGQDDVTGAWLRIFPQQGCTATSCNEGVSFVILAPDGSPVSLRVDLSSNDGRLDPATVRGFNPQPEPPLNRPTPGQIDFALSTAQPATTLSAILRLRQGTQEIPLD